MSANGFKERFLRVGGKEPKETGIPFLPPFYAYLLKLSDKVGLVDIYPWLAEVMFHSDVVEKTDGCEPEQANVIAFFIDDQKDNIANSMHPEPPGNEWSDDFARFCYHVRKEHDSTTWPRIFVVDTYGRFHRPDELNDRIERGIGLEDVWPNDVSGSNTEEKEALYVRSALAGAGNPARMLQKFTALGRLSKMPAPSNGESGKLGALNVFVFNSITYLTRTIGFREAMQLIRAILEQGVWKPNPAAEYDSEYRRLRDKDGLLFAILHEGVHSPDEIRYAETFFDGVIRFDAHYSDQDGKKQRKIAFAIEQFPLLKNSEEEKFAPNYEKARLYLPRGGRRLLREELEEIEREKVWPNRSPRQYAQEDE